MKFTILLKKPSGFLPLLMSSAAIADVIIYLAVFGNIQQEDESAAARIFQLLILLEVPIMMYFAAKWLPKFPKQAIPILVIQVGAIAAALAPILILEA